MNRFFTYSFCLLIVGVCGVLLISCDNWDLPGRKSQRNCTKPSGNLTTQIQQLKVDFSISNSAGTINKVSWDFGNGSTSATTGTTVSYSYSAPGAYTIKATLTNTCGQETILSQSISVNNAVLPTVSLQTITNIFTTSATGGMTILSNGNATITQYGICYSSVHSVPNKDDDAVTFISASPVINSSIPFSLTGLQPNTLYYVRSFAVNSIGPSYSNPVQTIQTGQDPKVAANGTASIGIFSASINYIVYNYGSPAATEYGIYFSSTTTTPDVNSTAAKVTNPPIGTYVAITLPDLKPSTTYYYIPYARLPSGEVKYGTVASFTTQADPVAQDLVANVTFTDQSLQDASGYNNHVKLVGNPTFTMDRKGKVNAAISLNGAGDYFYMPENANGSLHPDAISISIWIKPFTLDRRMTVYNKSDFTTGDKEMYSSLLKLAGTNDTGPDFSLSTDIKQNGGCRPGIGWQTFPVISRFALNAWHHLVFTYTGKTIQMYLDGALLSARNDLPNTSIDPCYGGELKFGAQNLELKWYFYGAMDDIRIYKRAITAEEVKTLFNQ